ncbi:MAG: ATP-grasp domain-containing protein [Alphaproteobacteria bacterium]|nr:ATP-grasp domain-containing protein [Alphaproteobacteria bacterium]MCB9693525.1 ATP-grasp domain-containing protein [Alphaproteobacteria bacterium]
MFRRILIANRGEVAARVARTAKRMGIEVVAVASTADVGSGWLADVDTVVTLGGARAAQSYLDQEALIAVGMRYGCAAVHPGWGFLSENDMFATRCEAAGLTFIGPPGPLMRRMGDKAAARSTMEALGLAGIPGSAGALADLDEAREVAASLGYPVLLKAVAGGGGRGMRAVEDPSGLEEAWSAATSEATSAFGDGRMYMERRIDGGRHVEVQVLADRYGNVVHLGERECSLQRRHQKVLEEARSPGLPAAERERILPLVASVVAKTGYVGAGTVEMLLDDDGKAWFMEMNTRLQVEHPISEQITGIDLVEHQLRVAAGEVLSLSQDDIRFTGHALECRINAEDPDDGFKPSPGRIERLDFPVGEGVRVDTHLRAGDRISPYYDSMVAKLITWGPDRDAAIARMEEALAGTRIEGVTTNIALHQRILRWDAFREGSYHTRSLEAAMAGGVL